MRRIHIALAVRDFATSVEEYSRRFGSRPRCTVDGTYALWRTDLVNFSINVEPAGAGRLRHLGFEDPSAEEASEEVDLNGFVWERFTFGQQEAEILEQWPHARFYP
jgi:catechol 2,3-dioxygenase-like lactoylglutathione lyase family enzyme